MKYLLCLVGIILSQIFSAASALPFGTYGPRSLSMGGTGVASATVSDAVFYNPALLAQYQFDEDKDRTSQFALPIFSARISRNIEAFKNFRDEDYDGKMSAAISTFNASNGSTVDAQSVLNASLALQDGLTRVSNGPIFGDVNVAFSIGIPSFKSGGAFFYNKRTVGDGSINKTTSDEALLNAYIDTMNFLLTGEGAPSPEVFNNGQLIDQAGKLTSTATAAALIMSEYGMAMATQIPISSKNNITVGITPKFVKSETYVIQTEASTDSYTTNRDTNNRWDITADFGIAKSHQEKWNYGLSIKNIIPLRYVSKLNTKIRIEPQIRAGVAYNVSWGLISLDMDVLKNKPVASGDKTQYVLLGVEKNFSWFKVRGGYSYNLSASGNSRKGLFSAGLQFLPFGNKLEFAYADNGIERAVGVQSGFSF